LKLEHIKHLAVEGNIGAGKTTLVKALGKVTGAATMLETFEDNPYLSDFYKGKQISLLRMETHFLIERYYQQREWFSKRGDVPVISDYSFLKCLVFAQVNLPPSDFKAYQEIFRFLYDQLPKPDLIVYLQVPPNVLTTQIQKRSRKMEQDIQEVYLSAIQNSYETHFKNAAIIVSGAEFYGLSDRELVNKFEEVLKISRF
jgi:deoxyguanosine kinase